MFELKKAVATLLMPLPAALALLVVGAALLALGRRGRLGRILVMASAAMLVFFSNRMVSVALVRPLEARYRAIPELEGAPPGRLAGCSYVVVLGGGNVDAPGLPATSLLSTSALGRVTEAVRILRVLPAARLVVSGPGRPGYPTHASRLAAAAESLGVDPSRIEMIDSARDTEDEARAVTALVRGARIALVTSAWHMPRAAHLFAKAGADFVPCPADFKGVGPLAPGMILSWGSDCLERSTLGVHEWLGLLWLRLRGA